MEMSETPVKFIDLGDMPSGYWKTKNGLMPIAKMSKGHIQNALKSISQTFKLNRQRYNKSVSWQKLSKYRIYTDNQYINVKANTNAKRQELLTELRNRN